MSLDTQVDYVSLNNFRSAAFGDQGQVIVTDRVVDDAV